MVAGGGTFFDANLVSDDNLKAVLKEDRQFIALTAEFEEISHDAIEDIARLVCILLDFDERLEKIIEIRKSFFEGEK